VLLPGPRPRDLINWNYNWTPSATEIFADHRRRWQDHAEHEPGGTTGDS